MKSAQGSIRLASRMRRGSQSPRAWLVPVVWFAIAVCSAMTAAALTGG